ncbi:DUF2922 domain-containing protein [Desulfallas sp. Bu1-1]|uniref:DUF2922 domain-containing protein n=1 Tax=Desulfallas sp. Bu1-1 TaxID=2787620 RepID=UPI0018A0D4FC|nr:DUF2922 domain-containing protein [Desulfallas sp. Bu1-1]MBF7083939.1 DUF2922 domain-containing protein [Desulfallas sp. Bu1-1]
MAETTKTLQMTFLNQAGGRVTISLADPRDTLTGDEVTSVMDLIIASNIFNTSGDDLVSKEEARIIDRTVSVIYEQQ